AQPAANQPLSEATTWPVIQSASSLISHATRRGCVCRGVRAKGIGDLQVVEGARGRWRAFTLSGGKGTQERGITT
ncbi:MAG TPA: hypothetical protein VHN13_10785, partial [Candidatus Tectomicrobia bacterium]|nr:hypothetical protein [Candidatus Tectomicrobia bacterium]